jgi:Asp-tRNA(Asn)/Glu-tRNA(Gln) amidotransferase A subunit family amidase
MTLNSDATGILAALANRDISAADLMAQTLDRIKTVNPAVNAIVALRPADDAVIINSDGKDIETVLAEALALAAKR